MNLRNTCCGAVVALSIAFSVSPGGARAEDIGVANFGTAANGMPWAVALEKGYFKDEGVDITGIISSFGGGPDLRILLGGHLPYAETGLSAIADADQSGADLVVVSSNANTVADILWVAMPGSPINSIKDLKGKRIAFTNPGSTTQALDYWLVNTAGFTNDDVKYVQTGSLGAALTALENHGVDIAPIAEPAYTLDGSKYKLIARGADIFPPISNTVGAVSKAVAEKQPQVVRGIIAARRKAVEFMQQNPHEAALLIAKHYKIKPDVIETVITNLMKNGTVKGVPYWGPGKIEYESLTNLAHAMKLIGAFKGDADWNKLVDESYLPVDLQSKK